MSASEDFEQGLRREVEGHVASRLRAQQEEILRVQGQIDEMLAGLAERLTADADDERLSLIISEQLRRAREQGMREAAQSDAQARATSDVALLKAAVEEIDEQRSQADILNALVNRAASFAPRVAFFVVKNERATGWRARGLEGTVGDDAVREISLPLAADTVLARVHQSRETWSGASGTHADDTQLTSKLGGEPPSRVVAVPLIARDKCVAVLYADSAGLEDEAINLEAIETLVRVAGMAVELLAAKRPAAEAAPRREADDTTAAAPGMKPAERLEASEQAQPAPSRPMPPQSARVEPSAGEGASAFALSAAEAPAAESSPAAEAAPAETPAEEAVPAAASMASLSEETATVTPAVSASAAEVTPPHAAVIAEEREERGIAPFVASESAPAAASSSFSAPLGSRRLGQDVELPIEVSEEERRYHQDARRFARLLVSEIKLYNEQKVKDGFERGDLYERLREEIDRSRQMYAKRVHPSVAPRYDYFHHELVATLARGDDARLGAGYPGTAVSA